jgi:type I restriction enzyme, S subunit
MRDEWEISKIGDYCEVIAGQSPEGQFYNPDGNGLPFYQGKKDFGDKFIKPPSTWTAQTTRVAREGDILMSVRAPVGPVNFATEEICIGRGLAAIRSKPGISKDFLFYQLLYLQPEIAGNEGAVFASINKSEIEALPLAIAPLPEQQRIVALLDEAFAGLATAQANAERNLLNARALFESHLQSVFSQRGEGWESVSLETLLDRRWIEGHLDGNHGSDYPRMEEFVQEGVPYISANCLDDQSNIDMSRAKFLTPARRLLHIDQRAPSPQTATDLPRIQ